MTRIALFAALGAALALAAGTSPALAAPLATAPSGAVVLSTARSAESVVVSRPVSGVPTRQKSFEILCGGMVPQDSALADHLWRVAGRLALRNWTPPRVTVRSVGSPSGTSGR